jgi:predicted MFS family arabinose efflux permease
MVAVYVNLNPIPLWELILINTIMFAGIMSRMIPSTALMTAVPKMEDRGAFMSVNSSLQQVAGGVASMIAGLIIVQERTGRLHHFDTLGYVVMVVMIICAFFIYIISRRVAKKLHTQSPIGKEALA